MILDDLLYLQQNAFEFTLEFNPGAGCFNTPADFDEAHGSDCPREWVNEEQRKHAYETGRFICARVYPLGSVSFYESAGTSLEDVISELIDCCRQDQARFRASGYEPHQPKTSSYLGPIAKDSGK